MAREIKFKDFEHFLSFCFKNIKRVETDEFIYLNIFTDTTKYNREYFDRIIDKGNFNIDKKIDIHFPETIVSENNEIYYVGKDKYNSEIEFLTIRIEKIQ